MRLDPIITPEIFAQSLVDDYSLAPSYLAIITKAIQDQLSDYKTHSAVLLDDGDVPSVSEDVIQGVLEGEEDDWWKAWRTTVRSPSFAKLPNSRETPHSRKRRKIVKDEVVETQTVPSSGLKDQPMSVEEFEDDDQAAEEMRILIKVRFISGTQ